MKYSLPRYLRCIHCGGSIALRAGYSTMADEVMSGELECEKCHQVYAISRGIPRMVDTKISTAEDLKTGETFEQAWRAFPRMDERYRQQLGDWLYPVDLEFLKDKLVLDCGCGKGRHTKVMAETGARAVFAVDIGGAIDVAYENVGHLPNVHIVQADVANMPFGPIMDFAFSLGVLDHMENPERGVVSMAERLNENGSLSIWVYGFEGNWWIIGLVNPARLAFTSKLPGSVLKIVSGLSAVPVFLWSKFAVRPWRALQRSAPFLPNIFYQDYMYYISKFDFHEIHHIAHDHLVAPLAHYFKRDQVISWFKTAGLPDPIVRWHNRNSWAAFSSRNSGIYQMMRERISSGATREPTKLD